MQERNAVAGFDLGAVFTSLEKVNLWIDPLEDSNCSAESSESSTFASHKIGLSQHV